MTEVVWKDQELSRLQGQLVEAVLRENTRQLRKWGIQEHSPAEWALILGEEWGEICQALCRVQWREHEDQPPSDDSLNEVEAEAIQVATLALKIAEMAASQRAAP